MKNMHNERYIYIIPSVTINEGTRPFVTMMPVMVDMAHPATMAMIRPTTMLPVLLTNDTVIAATATIWAPTDRSILPEMITNDIPSAIIPITAWLRRIFIKFCSDRN